MGIDWKEVATDLAYALHGLAFGTRTGHDVGEALTIAVKTIDSYRKLVKDDEWPYGQCSYCGEHKRRGAAWPSYGAPYQGGS